jgi:RNA polymerase sigma-70 factor, ECF subfamily
VHGAEPSIAVMHQMLRTMQNDRAAEKRLAPASSVVEDETLEIFSRYRGRLFSIAYRMLGSASDAEDILQEAFIRWQESSRSEIASPEAFLVTIVSRLCLNHLDSARVKREEYFGPWLPEPVFSGQISEQLSGHMRDPFSNSQMDGTLSLAFLVLLERLAPMERAVFLLREVFDYEYAEIASILGQSQSNCRQILRRARQRLKQARPRFDPSPHQREELFHRFIEASSQGDMDGLLALISKDIVLYADGGGKARAVPNPIFGADNVARLFLGPRARSLRKELASCWMQVNGELALVSYCDGQPFSVLTIGVAGSRICNIFIVSNPDKLARIPMLSPQHC